VTGVARALPRTDPDPGAPAGPDATAVVPIGAVIRAVPDARPEVEVTSPPAEAAPPATPSVSEPSVSEPLASEPLASEPLASEPLASEPSASEPASDPEPVPASAPQGRRDRRAARGPGVRERRRHETRAKIVDAAAELFAERGFDTVSVMEIARRAGVVEKTVFNHFPVKEGLVFDADPPMRAALLNAVRRRPAGESVSAAAGSFVVAAVSLLGSPEAATGVAQMARVIRGSRTLQVREREILGDLTDALAGLIAEETGAGPGEMEPWLAAHAVLGLYASLLNLARDRVLSGVDGPELAAELRRQGRRGLSLLQFGLAGYAKKLSSSG
jgi:AcrR family transcriptional regulator